MTLMAVSLPIAALYKYLDSSCCFFLFLNKNMLESTDTVLFHVIIPGGTHYIYNVC